MTGTAAAGVPEHILRYAAVFETMTAENVSELRALLAPDVHFRDPFNDVRDARRMVRIMAHMYQTCDVIAFRVADIQAEGDTAFMTWSFRFRPRRMSGPPWQVDGVTELHFDAAGKVTAHLDYWDSGSQFYARLPVLGWAIRKIRRRLEIA